MRSPTSWRWRAGRKKASHFWLAHSPNWSDSYFAYHNWWHRGSSISTWASSTTSSHSTRARSGRADRRFGSTSSTPPLCSGGLRCSGGHRGPRRSALAGAIEPLIGEAIYLFNDWHAVMAFGLAGRRDLADRLIVSNRDGATGTNRAAVDGAGMDLLEGFVALAFGAPDLAVDRLVDVRPRARVVGGSNAQRHVIDLTLLAAAASSGNGAWVRADCRADRTQALSASASIEPSADEPSARSRDACSASRARPLEVRARRLAPSHSASPLRPCFQ